MISQHPHRKLACIMFTDMVGFSALAQEDEGRALELLEEYRRLLRPILAEHGGHEIKTLGDGFLIEFGSAVEAARCAIALQQAVRTRNESAPPEGRLHLRIGLHVGDVVLQDGDVYGDGVNIASRVQACAPPDGICLTGAVAQQIENKLGLPVVRMGTRRLKNIRSPVALYRIAVPWDAEAVGAGRWVGRWWRRVDRQRAALAGMTLLLVAGVGLWLAERRPASFAAGGSVRSIAVLPLANLSGDPEQEYFADGMTEALIVDLAKIGSLRVISRTSAMRYKGSKKSVPEIARDLNVDAVVEGSVLRSGDDVRITAQLIHGPTDRHLWGESYQRDLRDVIALQGELARAIAAEIEAEVTPEEQTRLARARPVDPAAHEAYLRGRLFWNKRTEEGLWKARDYFQQAIEIDPTNATGYAGLADAYQILGNNGFLAPDESYPKVKAAALKALEIDETLAEAHNALAGVLKDYEWDWAGAEREFRRALELNPSYAIAHQRYATYLVGMGRMEEALGAIKRALELDPLSPRINSNLGYCLYVARDYDQALTELTKAVDLDPLASHIWLAQVYLQKGMVAQALAEAEKAAALNPEGMLKLFVGYVYAAGGRRAESQKLLAQIEDAGGEAYFDPTPIALIYAALGEKDRAFAWLEKGYATRDLLSNVLRDPAFDLLRSDPRFQDLLRRMGLPT